MTLLEIITLILTFTSNLMLGSRNVWGWGLALIVNVLWLLIGIDRIMPVIVISSLLFLITNIRGFVLWNKKK